MPKIISLNQIGYTTSFESESSNENKKNSRCYKVVTWDKTNNGTAFLCLSVILAIVGVSAYFVLKDANKNDNYKNLKNAPSTVPTNNPTSDMLTPTGYHFSTIEPTTNSKMLSSSFPTGIPTIIPSELPENKSTINNGNKWIWEDSITDDIVGNTKNVTIFSYGKENHFPQICSLDRDSSYFRCTHNKDWGLSVILAPSFWVSNNMYIQGLEAINLNISQVEHLGILSFSFNTRYIKNGVNIESFIQVSIKPPKDSSTIVECSLNQSTTGIITQPYKQTETFRPLLISSMYISAEYWDSKQVAMLGKLYPFSNKSSSYVVVNSNEQQSNSMALIGGKTNEWKPSGAPNLNVTLNKELYTLCFLTESKRTSDDNIGCHFASSSVIDNISASIIFS